MPWATNVQQFTCLYLPVMTCATMDSHRHLTQWFNTKNLLSFAAPKIRSTASERKPSWLYWQNRLYMRTLLLKYWHGGATDVNLEALNLRDRGSWTRSSRSSSGCTACSRSAWDTRIPVLKKIFLKSIISFVLFCFKNKLCFIKI